MALIFFIWDPHMWDSHVLHQQYKNRWHIFLDRIIALDDTWVHMELKWQSSQWQHLSSQCPQKLKQEQGQVKAMLILAHSHQAIIICYTVPHRQMVDACGMLCQLPCTPFKAALGRVCPGLLAFRTVLLHGPCYDAGCPVPVALLGLRAIVSSSILSRHESTWL